MNDLDLLAELGSETRLASLTELRAARARLTTAIDAETASLGRGTPVPSTALRRTAARVPSWRGPWRGRRLAVSAVIVATAAAVATLIVTGGPPRHASPRAPAVVRLTAYQILDRAAAAALTEPTVVPRPDQFVYTKVSDGAGGGVVQSWLSVDGKHNGLVMTPKGRATQPGCINGHITAHMPGKNGKPFTGKQPISVKNPAALFDGPLVTKPCAPQPAYFPDLPASPGAALQYLTTKVWGNRAPIPVGVSKAISGILASDYFLPGQRAALYTLLTRVPSLTVVHGVRDAAGRPGVGVEWRYDGARGMNIFDPHTFAYLGTTTWDPNGQPQGQALMQIAIVSHPGQVP